MVARTPRSYLGNATFSPVWEFTQDGLERVTEPTRVNFIYLKGVKLYPRLEPGIPHCNPALLTQIADDKLLSAQTFPNLMPKTLEITQATWDEVLAAIPNRILILKPRKGEGGEDIIIARKEELDPTTIDWHQPYIAQPFLDTRGGIPNVVKGRHDLRLMVTDGTVRQALIRIPAPGQYLANITQGGKALSVPLKDVPASAKTLAKKIDLHFATNQPRIYSVDFLFVHGEPVLCELNSRPAVPRASVYGELYARNQHDYLVKFFKKHAGGL